MFQTWRRWQAGLFCSTLWVDCFECKFAKSYFTTCYPVIVAAQNAIMNCGWLDKNDPFC